MPERVASRMPPRVCNDRQSNHRDDDRQRRPSRNRRVDHRQPLVAESADDERADAARVEDQQQLPGREGEVWVVHGDGAGDEAGEAEVDRERDGPVSDQPDPAGDVG